MPIEITCIICGKTRKTSPSRTDAKYCSLECKMIGSKRNRIPKVCQHCGKEFTVQPARHARVRHCSKACQKAAGQTMVTKQCPQCKKDFQVTLSKRAKRFCSHECIIDHKRDMRIEPEHIRPPLVRKKAVVTALGYASLVLFCFKRRWNYQGGYRERFKLFIRLARDAGWKGSIVKALQRKEPKWIEIQPDSTMITYPHHSIIS